jgi:hypothetical protein
MSSLVGGIIGLPVGAVTGFISGAATYQIKTGKLQELLDGDVGLGITPGILGIALGGLTGTIGGAVYGYRVNNGIVSGAICGMVSGFFAGIIMN